MFLNPACSLIIKFELKRLKSVQLSVSLKLEIELNCFGICLNMNMDFNFHILSRSFFILVIFILLYISILKGQPGDKASRIMQGLENDRTQWLYCRKPTIAGADSMARTRDLTVIWNNSTVAVWSPSFSTL